MRRIRVDELEGNEILARHILTENDIELMSAGTVIKKEYIERLTELGYEYVYVKAHERYIDFEQPDFIVKEEVRKESIETVKNVLDRHIFKNTTDIEKMCKVADNIIDNIINNDDIKNELTNIRKEGYDICTHSINVCSLSSVLALKAGLSKERVSEMAKGSLLHDIGLKYTTVDYQNKDESDMSKNELIEYRKHVINGYEGLKDVEWLSETAKRIVLLHHEKGKGAGYPFKHHYSELEEEIKIVAICEAFDSMVSGMGGRIYKVYEAIEYIKVHASDYFEKRLADLFIKMVALYPVGTKVVTSQGDIGVVIKQNKDTPERPVIKILASENGNKYQEDVEVNLLEALTVFIVDTLE